MAVKVGTTDILKAAYDRLGKGATVRDLQAATGISRGTVHNWLKEQRAAAGELSHKAAAQREKIKERNTTRYDHSGSQSGGGQPAGASNSGTAPVGYASGIEWSTDQDPRTDQGDPRGVPGRQGTDRELYRGPGRASGTDEYPDRGDDKTPRRDADVLGANQGTLGDKLLRGAAGFVEKTKENFQRRAEEKPKVKKAGKAMSQAEAEDIRETYTQALIGTFGFMDDAIKFSTGGHQDPEIWNTIDDGDIKLIVDYRLEAAQHSARAAAGVRRTIAWYQKALVGIIVLPRAWQTMQYYSEHGFDLPIKVRRPRKLKVVPSVESSAS